MFNYAQLFRKHAAPNQPTGLPEFPFTAAAVSLVTLQVRSPFLERRVAFAESFAIIFI
jgi:hypothetical protein